MNFNWEIFVFDFKPGFAHTDMFFTFGTTCDDATIIISEGR